MIKRENISFLSNGVLIKGWLFSPSGKGPFPGVVMAHGWAAVKELFLPEYAELFVRHGFAVIVFDHRNFGKSEGHPRQEINPYEQIEGYRNAISYLETVPSVDKNRIGVWGTSYSGAHALLLGVLDPRVKCIVSQCPTISGSRNIKLRFPGDKLNELYRRLQEDRVNRMNGHAPSMVPFIPGLDLTSEGPAIDADKIVGNDAEKWFLTMVRWRLENWRNETTLKSLEYYEGYEPGDSVKSIRSAPVLMVLGNNDTFTPTEDAISAFESIKVPKKLVMVDGGHFDLYGPLRAEIAPQMSDWFHRYL